MRRYTLILVAIAFIAMGGAAAWAWYMGPVVGDLTRVGGWPERDFGSRSATPATGLVPTNAATAADIVIVGDSFSLPGVWQEAAFAGSGVRYTTYDIEHFCLNQYLDSAAFRAAPPRVVIVETVERLYLRRFGTSAWCPRHSERPVAADPGHWKNYVAPESRGLLTLAPGFALDAIRARWREWRSPDLALSGESMLTGLQRTSLFSNRRSDHILLCAGDLEKRLWTAPQLDQSAAKVRSLQTRVESNGRTTFIFVLVPDKSTSYAPYLRDPTLAADHRLPDLLAAAGVRGPRIDRALAAAIAGGMQDVFLPNDTHLSTAGFGLMAAALRHELTAGDKTFAAVDAKSDTSAAKGGS